MLDQSFSIENFKKIFEIENRKGNFNRNFYSNDFHKTAKELSAHRKKIQQYKQKYNPGKEDEWVVKLFKEKKKIEEKKEDALVKDLSGFSKKVNQLNFEFELSKVFHDDTEKEIFILRDEGASYFAIKQLQHNVKRTFDVKPGNRYLITKQVQLLLKDNFPKIIIRTDIKSFYESVPQYRLLKMVENNQLLTPKSKDLIKKLLYSYNKLTGQEEKSKKKRKGIPRGAAVSAYLAELYMRSIDRAIKKLSGVYYYARYVDDIIIFYTPNWQLEEDYLTQVTNVVNNYELELNRKKTGFFEVNNSIVEIKLCHIIHFLGYRFVLKNNKYSGTYLSKDKKKKYIRRIVKSLDSYLNQVKYYKDDAYKMLIHRFNYLTKNTKLHKPKKGLVGIYYSNSILDDRGKDLEYLDKEKDKLIDEKLSAPIYKMLNLKLKSYKFKDGFERKSFFNINARTNGKRIKDIRPASMRPKGRPANNYEIITYIWK